MEIENSTKPGISFIIPVYNEEDAITATIDRLRNVLSVLEHPFEIIVVDDGSTDQSGDRADQAGDVLVLRHPANSGYGRSLKTGIVHAQYDWLGIVDADGTYEIEKIPELVEAMERGFDMAVALRQNILDRDGFFKKLSRKLYIGAIRLLAGKDSPDPNSGLRLFSRDLAMTFFPFLCNSFSFTTSLTVFAFGGAFFVKFIPSHYEMRQGRSKVRHFRDTLRTIQLIVQGVTFFNPIKLYLLLAFTYALFIGLPTLALYIWCPVVAAPLLMVGTTTWLLVGIGALGDIFRISTIRPKSLNELDLASQAMRLRDRP